jgi:hypothetical protein
MNGLCELVRLNDLGRLYDVKHALESRGIEALVCLGWLGGRRLAQGSGKPRLLVRQQDLVYARWVAHAVGVDAWPDDDEPGEGEDIGKRAPAALDRKAG